MHNALFLGAISLALGQTTGQFQPKLGTTGAESPNGTGAVTSGSGLYPAGMTTNSGLPKHTIYAPNTPPANVSLPFISWASGACSTDGSYYRNFLTEIASYGYVIVADGAPTGNNLTTGGQSKVQDSRDSIDWAIKGGAARYGKIDTTKIASAGHSCGGLEAMSVAYHDSRVKLTMMFDIAIFQDERRYLLQELKSPVAWFVGGPKDTGYLNAEKDYALLPSGLPAYLASLDTGHMGTYSVTNGGKFGKAAVAYLQWQFRDNTTAKAVCQDGKVPGSMVSDNWNVTYKNWT